MVKGEFSKKLTASTLRKAKNTNLDYILFTENEQQGDNFAQRFTHAIKSVFNLGYDNVIAIGNDTPQLSTKHIKEAHQRLQENQPTIGPSLDGGFYLLALSKNHFDANKFESFAWQTNTIFKQVYQHITSILGKTEQPKTIYSLPAFYDLDQISQIKKLLAHLGTRIKELSICLQKLLDVIIFINDRLQSFNTSHYTSCFFNKGSPALLT